MNNTLLTLLSAETIRRYHAAGFWRQETIYAAVAAHARRAPNAYAARDSFRRVTYDGLVAAADRLAGDLTSRGVRPGQRVGLWLPSRIECAVVLLACSRNGYVCCPSLHRDHTTADVIDLLQRIRCAAFIGQAGYGAADSAVFSELGRVASLRHAYRLAPFDHDQPLLAQVGEGPSPPPKLDPDAIVYLAFTSGTTGEPKGVLHSDNTLLANARA